MGISLGGHILLRRPQLEILHRRKGFRSAADLPDGEEGPAWRAGGQKELHQLLELRAALNVFPAEYHARDEPGLKKRANCPGAGIGGLGPSETEEQQLSRQTVDFGIGRARASSCEPAVSSASGGSLARPFPLRHRRIESGGCGTFPGILPAGYGRAPS